MKIFLRNFFVMALLGLVSNVQAQLTSACDVQDILVQNVKLISSTATSCTVEFDVSATIDANNGNKYIYITSFLESKYPNYFKCGERNNGTVKAPRLADLKDAFLVVSLLNENGAVSEGEEYYPDPSVPLTQVDTVYSFGTSDGLTRVVLEGVRVTLQQACNIPTTLITDVFSTNARQGDPIQCVNCGIRTPSGRITIGGTRICNDVRVTLTNNTGTAQTVTYSLFADVEPDSVIILGVDTRLIPDTTVIIPAGATFTSRIYTLTGANAGKDVFVMIDLGQCATLPVSFKSFNANRNKGMAVLRWETSTEQNNKGFYVQRNTGRGWSDVGYVASKANGGNSNATLGYDFSDPNTEKGVTQYRILQVDLDGKSKVSDVRTVRGESQDNRVMIYPNPSNDGSVNIMFDDARGNRDVMVSDMSGRVVKQYRNVTASNMRIDNLQAGVYSIRIANVNDGTQRVEKLVVNK
jgi:hypothetical protein